MGKFAAGITCLQHVVLRPTSLPFDDLHIKCSYELAFDLSNWICVCDLNFWFWNNNNRNSNSNNEQHVPLREKEHVR